MPKVAVIAVKHPTDPDLFLHGLRTKEGTWNLIGGHFKEGETPTEAARREMKEEAGLDLPIDFAMDKHYGDHHVHLFYATPNGELNLDTSNDPDAEFLTFKWLNPSVHRNLHVPASRNILVDHMKSIQGLQKNEAADKETAQIKLNSKEEANKKKHKFKAAEWTHPNGHPRCIRCGGEENIDGMCNPAALEKAAPKIASPNIGLKRLKQIKQDNSIGNTGVEYDEQSIDEAMMHRKMSRANKLRLPAENKRYVPPQENAVINFPPPVPKTFKKDELAAPKFNQKIRDVANQYAQSKGITLKHDIAPLKVDPKRSKMIADAYHAAPHDPSNPHVKQSYNDLINETNEQFQHIKNSGLKMTPIKAGQQNPYAGGSKDLLADVSQNNHMWYYPTDQGYGSSDQVHDHPMLTPTNEVIGGHKLLANDVFRIVHDYFGHAKEGHGFGPNGEENAWAHHKQMYSPSAQKALTAETRGQNSWVNFGPHGENNRANPSNTIYADQKATILPDWALENEGLGKHIEIDATMFIEDLEKSAPRHLNEVHPHGDKIAKLHPNGKLMWHSSKKIADNHDRILSSPEMTQNFLKTVPESHRGLMAGLISHVAKDPNRHFIPTEENGTQKLRARHIKDLIYGGGDVKLDTSNPDILKITRNSHSQGINSGAKIAFNFKRSGLGKSETNDGRATSGTMRTVWDGTRFVSSLYTERSEIHLKKGGKQDSQGNNSNRGTEGLEKADRLKLKVEPFTAHPDHFDPKKHDFVVHLHRGDEKLGFMAVTHKKEGIMPFQFEVSDEHRRKGHGTRLAAYAQILSNKKILTTPDQSPAYNKFKTSFDSKNKFKPSKS